MVVLLEQCLQVALPPLLFSGMACSRECDVLKIGRQRFTMGHAYQKCICHGRLYLFTARSVRIGTPGQVSKAQAFCHVHSFERREYAINMYFYPTTQSICSRSGWSFCRSPDQYADTTAAYKIHGQCKICYTHQGTRDRSTNIWNLSRGK